MMKRKVVSWLLVLTMVAGSLLGCGASKDTKEESSQEEEASGEEVDSSETDAAAVVNKTNRTGLPIVAEGEEIELTIGVDDWNDSVWGVLEDQVWFKELQEATGIKLNFEIYTEEATNLMFVERDYPDIIWGLGAYINETQVADAGMAGDLVALDTMMEEWAPNLAAYYADSEHATYKAMMTEEDGHIYASPFINEAPFNYAIRDQWLINKVWLDEVGMEVPTTIDEFYDVLVAFRDARGTGSIPEDAYPYYFFGTNNLNDSCLDLFNSFGYEITGQNWWATLDDDGNVVFNWTNEGMKEPLAFLNKLYEEDLIPAECVTDSWDVYMANRAQNAEEAFYGVQHYYLNPDGDTWVKMGPLDAENGNDPIKLSQYPKLERENFMISSSCEYPEAAMRLLDIVNSTEWALQGVFGTYEGGYMVDNGDGTYNFPNITPESGVVNKEICPTQRSPIMITTDMMSLVTFEEGHQNYDRALAVEFYEEQDCLLPVSHIYPQFAVSQGASEELTDLKTELTAKISSYYADFILNGGVEEGWDDMINELESMGLNDYLEKLQTEYDAFMGK